MPIHSSIPVSINFACSSAVAQSNCCPTPVEATNTDPNEESPEQESKRRTEALIRLTCVFESDCYEVVELKPLWQDFQRNVSFSDRMESTSFEGREDSLYYLISRIDAYVNRLKHVRRNSGTDMPLLVEENLQVNLFPVILKECYRAEASGQAVSKQKSKTIGIILAHTSTDSTIRYLADLNRFA